MGLSNYTKVFTGDVFMVNRIVSELQEFDIIAIVKDQTESARLAGFGGGFPTFQEVHVNNDELEKAKAIIDNIT
ncbi:MAG: DUF2007 domain-containing protein [Aestuariibaculum sp.]